MLEIRMYAEAPKLGLMSVRSLDSQNVHAVLIAFAQYLIISAKFSMINLLRYMVKVQVRVSRTAASLGDGRHLCSKISEWLA
jgi:hypothetical protein